jgi:branched-chain amino acid transport system ATP-binding protein
LAETLLRARGVAKSFSGMMAVDNVGLEITDDRIAGIIGPNGAGKTTLVHLLTGHLIPDAGQITFLGDDITHLSSDERVRRQMCRTFQVVDVFTGLTVYQNVQIALITRQGRNLRFIAPSASEAAEEVESALNEVGLWELRHRRAEQLSHGQQRRLDLAVTLATDPRLCFLDEPTSGVSPRERDQVLELIRNLASARRTTFVIIEHDMELVFELCDWVTVMHRGAVLAEGVPDEIQANQSVREVYLGEEV